MMAPNMDALELVRKRLQAVPISELPALADKCGVPFGTLHKIKYGTTKNPRFDTVKTLIDFFDKQKQPA